MPKRIISFLILVFGGIIQLSCNENSVEGQRVENLVLQLDGELEYILGDCSATQVRTRNLGVLDFTNAQKVRFDLSGMTDADISSIGIFYVNNNENVFLVDLPDRNAVNGTGSVEVNSPRTNSGIFLRVTLRSSVCTGQLFHIRVSDLKIYTIN